MKVHEKELSDATRYLEKKKSIDLSSMKYEFLKIKQAIEQFIPLDGNARVLEIGTGTGWFQVLCGQNGINCKGLEISRQLVDFAHELGRKNGINVDIELGNIEDADIGSDCYDAILARATFEHVEHWREGIRKIYRALKPGGLFLFHSTNKFSLISTEYNLPFYGWLPDRWRFGLRKMLQGEDIMELGIDFNQFTYIQLHRFFRDVGFSVILDRFDQLDPDNLNNPKHWKKLVVRILRTSPVIKHGALFFTSDTRFICRK